MQAPISLCVIVRDEPLLEDCLKSIRDFVQEIVVVDTGSSDNTTIEIAKKYADKFEIYTECNNPETGLIENFSGARQRSFDLATQPWILWADADDIIIGAEILSTLVSSVTASENETVAFMFPYEYAYDEQGECVCLHYRERLFLNKNKFHWINPVHEVVVPKDGVKLSCFLNEEVIFKHQRQYGSKTPEPGRNLRILKQYSEKIGKSDPRQMYYLGLEYCGNGLINEAVQCLTKYVDLSGWDDERAMACLKLVEIYQAVGDYENGLNWAFKTIALKENWGEGYFAIARMFYFSAQIGGPDEMRNWERCVYFSRLGLSLPPTKTLLFINPLERQYEIHRYLNMALNKLGDVKGALDSVNVGLQKRPIDGSLLLNKKIYETVLAKHQILQSLNKLKELEKINQSNINSISNIIESGANKVVSELDDVNFWEIPSVWDFQSRPIQITDQQLQATVIMIWKQFMLHDEILSAISFLENAPYRVRHSFATQKALTLTKTCLSWMNSKEDFQKVNAPAFPEVEAGTKLPNKPEMAEGHRFDLIMEHLKPSSTIVDFGSMDGCFTNRYGLAGHKPIGLDVCESSVRLANKKAIEFNTGALHICTYFQDAVHKVPNNHFDYATSSDTYEHLRDPVNDMFLPAKEMLKSDGKFLLVTPHGAWMRGQYLEWAHPWVLARDGKGWLDPFPRAHLIAPTVWSVAKQFKEAGYWVKDCYVDLCGSFRDVEGQGNIFAEAHLQFPKKYDDGLDIVFFAGNGVEAWTPHSVKQSGMGGSETMMIEMAKRLAIMGHQVRVYNSCGTDGGGIYDGVEYHITEKFQDLKCDVLIVSRRADMLGDQYNVKSKLKLLWVHDVYAIAATNELLLKADRILALTHWHKQNLINVHNLHSEHIIVTRNGIDLKRFDREMPRNPIKCINSSSPDRSWPVLLEVWPEIKKQVPEAELHLFYGFKNWEFSAPQVPGHMDLINSLKQKLKEMEPLGVMFHDRVSQEELANEFLSAGCWIYPTWFTESSCLSAMEAQAAGLHVITSSVAALNETVSDRGVLIDGEWTSPEYKEKFIESVVAAMKNDNEAKRADLQKYAIENFGLDTLAEDWEKMFYDLIEELQHNPIVPYQPTAPYRK